ncbi:MAG: DUF853 family protein, partial [Deltaproteobacteria bacterium]|nr:DUF853 family protein [Deltaproteobacteria bacterium]
MAASINVAHAEGRAISLLPSMSNRHGLITGATGTGKSVSLKVLAEGFARLGVPVFLSDVKGDLAGLAMDGDPSEKLSARCKQYGLPMPQLVAPPVAFWDVFGKLGHPARCTVTDMGPALLSRMLSLNETQAGVLALSFKIADDHGLLLLDFKDLRALLQYIGDNAKDFRTGYGNVSAASIGAIQRGLLQLETEGGESLFGEPALDVADLLRTDELGRG